MEETQPINSNPENSGLTQYIQIVMIVFMVVSQSEGEGHFSPSFSLFNKAVFSPSNIVTFLPSNKAVSRSLSNKAVFSPSNMVTFSPSNKAVSHLLIWLFCRHLTWSLSHLLIWSLSRLLIWSLSHLLIWSLSRLLIWSLSRLLIRLFLIV